MVSYPIYGHDNIWEQHRDCLKPMWQCFGTCRRCLREKSWKGWRSPHTASRAQAQAAKESATSGASQLTRGSQHKWSASEATGRPSLRCASPCFCWQRWQASGSLAAMEAVAPLLARAPACRARPVAEVAGAGRQQNNEKEWEATQAKTEESAATWRLET